MRRIPVILSLLLGLGLLGPALGETVREKVLPPRNDELARFLRSARVEQPWRVENLTIFPVVVDYRVAGGGFDCLTMEEAMDRDLLTISEYHGGRVNQVYVRNEGKLPVFLMSGEMIAGAKQDRTVSQDTLVAPHSKIALDVYCVEQGRWVQRTEHFSAAKAAAPASIRLRAEAAPAGAAQSEVWREVAGIQARTASTNETSSLYESYQSKQLQSALAAKREQAIAKMEALACRPQVNGVIVAVGNEFLAADLFYRPSLFHKLWPRLLDSYLLDAVNRPERGRRPSREDAESFLRSALSASQRERGTPGLGDLIELRGETMGSALIYRQAVVHLQLFPRVHLLAEPAARPRTPSLEFRREQLYRPR